MAENAVACKNKIDKWKKSWYCVRISRPWNRGQATEVMHVLIQTSIDWNDCMHPFWDKMPQLFRLSRSQQNTTICCSKSRSTEWIYHEKHNFSSLDWAAFEIVQLN